MTDIEIVISIIIERYFFELYHYVTTILPDSIHAVEFSPL